MEVRRYLSTAWKWLWLILLAAILSTGASYYFTKKMPPVYESEVKLLVDEASSSDARSNMIVSQDLAVTYAEVMASRPVLQAVVEADPSLHLTSTDLASMVEVNPVPGTQLLILRVHDSDPQRAANIADRTASVFITRNQASQELRFKATKDGLTSQMQTYSKLMDDTRASMERLRQLPSLTGAQQSEMASLQEQLSIAQNEYMTLLRSYEDVRLTEDQSTNTVSVIEPALVPTEAISPNLRLNLMVAALAGLVVGLLAAFLVEYLDDTVKSSEQVQKEVGLNTLGSIWRFRRGRANGHALIVREKPYSPVAEAYRFLLTSIQFASLGQSQKTILVTSTHPEEGKTMTIANLAAAMAQAGRQVIAVDSDVRKPTLHTLFGLENKTGLTNALVLNNCPNVEVFLQDTDIPRLRILTSGTTPPNPLQLLNSNRMTHLVSQLTEHADVVLFDSPPLLSVADASLVASRVDGVVMVVDVSKTRAPALKKAIEVLARSGANILGVTLNKASNGKLHGNYYRHYNYGEAQAKDLAEASKVIEFAGDLAEERGHTIPVDVSGTQLKET